MAGVTALPTRPPWPRQATALGVALGLHVALALAWGDGLGERAGPEGHAVAGTAGAAGSPAPLWLALLPAEPVPPAPALPAITPPQPAPLAVPELAEAVGTPGATPGVVGGRLLQHGAPWTLGYPDADLGAERRSLVLALRLDALQRVQAVMPAAAGTADEELVRYVGDRLMGAVLDGATVAPGEALCLRLAFDAGQASVDWRLERAASGGGCAAR
jgi:hypothetical protein